MRVPRTIPGQSPTPQNHMRWTEQLAQVIAGNISYGESMANTDQDLNLNIWKATGTSPVTPDTNFTVNHSLGRVPITIVGQDSDNGGLIYRGSVPWTTTTVSLKCTTASANYNLVLA